MKSEIPELDSITCPLDGVRMVEAAAGTGKTYNIQNLVLRLVLERDLPVSSILVVTYTEAATAELKSRIRDMLRNALRYADGGALPENELPRIAAILEHAEGSAPRETLIGRLRNAVLDFDDGSVSTIHGFCQRMLAEYAFESGGLFDTVIRTDSEEIICDLLTDFYRQEFYSPDHAALRAALREFSAFTPDAYFKTVAALYARPDLHLRTRAQEPFDTAPLLMRIARLLDEVSAAVHPGILTAFGDIMKSGYYPADCAEAERILLEWKNSASLHGVFSTLQKFSPEQVRAHIKVRIAKEPAAHAMECLRDPFFAKNAELLAALQLYCDTLLPSALRFVRREFERKKRKENFLTFDDLLLRVRASVRSDEDSFVRAVRGKYRAAIVDEFQDTDPVQYEIFCSLFAFGPCPTLFMVGDPRQAIYAFRGGDIAAYRRAERDCLESPHGGKYGLTANYRSSGAMIRAVNTVFHGHPYPFADSGITFAEVRAPADAEGNVRPGLLRGGAEEPFPLKITWLSADGKPPTSSQLAERTIPLCAKEIRRMLGDSSLRLPERPEPGVRPGDFAVLVFSGYEGMLVQSALAEYGIPSVIANAGNVFDSEAAGELACVLEAIADPRDGSAVVRAMHTDLVGYDLPDLIRIHLAEEGGSDLPLDGVQEKLEHLRKRWENSSFAEMFHELLREFRVSGRILGKPRGERKLTDLLQLGEILHHESTARSLSVSGVLHFLERQRSDRLRDKSDEYEILLETDRAAVRIMTVHKSKGLEFPLVMLPTLFTWNADKYAEHYHLPDGRLEQDFTDSPESAALASGERLQELLRLAYVAVTRAKYYCHIFWGECKNPISALDWIFRMRTLSILPELRDLRACLAASQESVRNAVPPEWFASPPSETERFSPYLMRREEIGELHLPVWKGEMDPNWRITSFSGLIAGGTDAPADYDPESADLPSGPKPEGIFAIPGGVRTGNAWHEIFERLDFQDPEKNLASLVEEKLSLYGILGEGAEKAERIALTMAMVRNVLASPLPGADGDAFTLSEIPRADRVSEMQFHYCFAKGFRVEDLRPVLDPYVTEKLGVPSWDSLRGTVSGGFLNGFIDLVFQRNGRFYIADWKSNRLGGDPRNFLPDGIRATMLNHFYFLQYLIYSVALIKFLRLRIGTYAEEEHERYFGGVYYLFVRGVTPEQPGAGVYHDRPPFALLTQLEQLLG